MRQHELSNTDVVSAIPALHLTHKMVAKARRGRRLSQRVQRKVTQAVNASLTEKGEGESISYRHEDLFNYDGG